MFLIVLCSVLSFACVSWLMLFVCLSVMLLLNSMVLFLYSVMPLLNSMVLFLYSVMRLCLSIVSGYLLRGYSDNLALYPKFKY